MNTHGENDNPEGGAKWIGLAIALILFGLVAFNAGWFR